MRPVTLCGVSSALLVTVLAGAPAGSAAERAVPGGSAQAQAAQAQEARAQETPAQEGAAISAARAAAAGVRFGTCPREGELPAPVECGWVEVPLDYARPDGEKIRLLVSRARATGTPAERQGALVYNPGGPGGSGLTFPLESMSGDTAWAGAARAYDLIGYDPRGVGRSAPLSCADPKDAAAPAPDPDPASELDKLRHVAAALRYALGCERRSGRMLAHMTTPDNARDLDVIRAALGEPALNFVGVSYGTYLGAVYATLFPDHVRRMVLDSPANPDPGRVWYQNNLDQSAAFERRWADWRSWVAANDQAYGLGSTPEDVRRAYEGVRRALARQPAGGKVGPGDLQAAYLQAGYSDEVWGQTAYALSQFVRGNPDPLVRLAARDPASAAEEENTNAVYTAVECADAPWPRSWARWNRDSARLARTAPFETWDNTWMNLPCAFWPRARQQPLDVGRGIGRIERVLILAAERDAATPYDGALELQRRLTGSALVTERDAGSHGVTELPNPCVSLRVSGYLLGGDPGPAATSCPAHPAPEATVSPSDPPNAAGRPGN